MIDKLTIRFKPFQDESLTSYFIRISNDNGLNTINLLNSVRKIENEYLQLSEINIIDKVAFKHININGLEKLLGFKVDLLLKNTFYRFIERFGDGSEVERSRFISGSIRNEFSFCPKCLKEKMYYKLIWKISEIKICDKHGCTLISKCVKCNSKITYEDIISAGICNKCGHKISARIDIEKLDSKFLQEQVCLYKIWNTLIYGEYDKMNSKEIAYKILYIINNKEKNLSREILKSESRQKFFIPMLLQYARGTTKNRRVLHISTVIKILLEYKINIQDFLNLNVPKKFMDSIENTKQTKLSIASCMAPWCGNYKVEGSLIKTNTSYKKSINDNVLLYYMYCSVCGCEYAYDKKGKLVERTEFIDGFNRLSNTWSKELSLGNLAHKNCITKDKLKRLLAYFNTRGMYLKNENSIILKEDLINVFIREIKKGRSLREIRHLKYWNNYREYLLYRFHKEVMLNINMKKVTRNKKVSMEKQNKKVTEVLEKLLKANTTITLNQVCRTLNVSPETIRNWRCNKIISSYKNKQKSEMLLKKGEIIRGKIEEFMKSHETEPINTKTIYEFIEIQRNILWRNYPELTSYITNNINEHNKSIQK
ncbi:TniQ family protein [Clostridium intestinale]|uniref:TniQ domain-containing protein n=1 Tax=Clostridium intestinale URNW TaxID=1294142 RepID=U2Q8A2_9CLOT|nr:TniQ family protein [Clostridium intestinale]ERK32414.1 hypothetical protein CINTURNW_0158 [Clostridium intestinale URNW]